MRSVGDLPANLASCSSLADQAASEGAQVAIFPECFSLLGTSEQERLAIAEDLEAGGGPVLSTLRNAAMKHRIWVIGGGTPEVIAGDPRRSFNTAVVLDPGGNLISRYRKIHLFDVDIPGGASLRESDATAAGSEPVAVTIEGVRVGISICYDLRFPELYRKLVADLGAEVLLVPAAFTAHTGAAHWHVLLRARAIENQAWVVAAAQWGKHNDKRESFGHTMIVNPWGTIIAERPAGDGVVTTTLDGDIVAKRRAQMPCLRHAALSKSAP
jgi:predicted amidohydrolase